MHLADGLLPPSVCLSGYGLSGLFTWYSFKQIYKNNADPSAHIPKASLLTAAFFIASLVNIPLPPTSVHLLLNGLLGVVLGFFAFPAILIGLVLQAIAFGHGGMTTLGVNAAMIGIPALLSYGVFQGRKLTENALPAFWSTGIWGGFAGAFGLSLSTLIFVGITILAIPAGFGEDLIIQEQQAIAILALSHLPVIVIEGIFTAFLVVFLERVKPELLTSAFSDRKV